jgi:hypothetical protein
LFLAENLPIVIPSFRVPIRHLPTRSLHNLLHHRRGLDRERAAAGLPYQTLISTSTRPAGSRKSDVRSPSLLYARTTCSKYAETS